MLIPVISRLRDEVCMRARKLVVSSQKTLSFKEGKNSTGYNVIAIVDHLDEGASVLIVRIARA